MKVINGHYVGVSPDGLDICRCGLLKGLLNDVFVFFFLAMDPGENKKQKSCLLKHLYSAIEKKVASAWTTYFQ